MKAIRMFTLFSILLLQNVCLSQIVQNGAFENDFTGWNNVDATISTSVVQSGGKSLEASDPAQNQYSYVWQPLTLDYNRHEINFWVYPASGTYFSAFELIANWQTSPPVVFITRVLFQENSISFTAVDNSVGISNVLNLNSWNKVTIQVDKASLTQDFYINDNPVSSLTSSSFPTIEHLLVGDLSVTSMYGTVYFDEISILDRQTTDVAEPTTIPSEFALLQNFPNPFNPSTQIFYRLSKATDVELTILNIGGQKVRTLVNEFQSAGQKSIVWHGLNDRRTAVSSGVYFFQLKAGGFQETKKMVLMR